MNKIFLVFAFLGAVIIGASTYVAIFWQSPTPQKRITQYDALGKHFLLKDTAGNDFSSQKLLGKKSMIYFGFTYCPDVCPMALSLISEVIFVLDKYKIQVNPIFITIDPTRDTPEFLSQFLKHFNPKIIGLTDSEESIKKVADDFKVYYKKTSDNEDYMLDHSSFIYIMDENFKYIGHFVHDTKPMEIVEFFRVNK